MKSEWVDFADKEADVVKGRTGTFLAVQWLRLHPSNARALVQSLVGKPKILHAERCVVMVVLWLVLL